MNHSIIRVFLFKWGGCKTIGSMLGVLGMDPRNGDAGMRPYNEGLCITPQNILLS